MIAHKSSPPCIVSAVQVGDLSLWHVTLPSGDVIHHITYSLDPAPLRTAADPTQPAAERPPIALGRFWPCVTNAFERRARKSKVLRICPLCCDEAHRECIPYANQIFAEAEVTVAPPVPELGPDEIRVFKKRWRGVRDM